MIDYDSYPARHMIEGVRNYIEHGIPPGSFLMAVLENDLRTACGKADDINRHLIFETVAWLHNEAPWQCWGSPAAVTRWIKLRAAERAKEQA